MKPGDVAQIVSSFNEIFEHNVTKILPVKDYRKDPDGTKYLYEYVPKKSTKTPSDGLRLVNNMGFITIEIIFEFVNKRECVEVGHTYRYVNDEHTYTMEYDNKLNPKQDSISNYHFRYDKDLRPANSTEPYDHLQVLQNVPRFITGQIELVDFLKVVRNSCFDEHTAPIKKPFFVN